MSNPNQDYPGIFVVVQEPHQGPAIVYSVGDAESLIAGTIAQYGHVEGDDAIDTLTDLLMDASPDDCRLALAHDMRSAMVYTLREALAIARDPMARHSAAIADALADYACYPEVCYMHPQSGDVQTMNDWEVDSLDWGGDAQSQLDTLIPVQMNDDGDWEAT